MNARASILFVDDEVRVLTAMRAMFRRDYDVHVANSGAEGLEILRAQPIDVVVSDQRMPEMTGVEMLEAARSIGMEDEIGSVRPGKRADFTVLSEDPRDVPPEAIREIEVRATVLDGRVHPIGRR